MLSTRSNVYYLDIWLPIDIDSDECGAQFDKATHVRISYYNQSGYELSFF